MSALEMLGVDNARIEVEGGHEMPIIDGSALGWTIDIQTVICRQRLESSLAFCPISAGLAGCSSCLNQLLLCQLAMLPADDLK